MADMNAGVLQKTLGAVDQDTPVMVAIRGEGGWPRWHRVESAAIRPHYVEDSLVVVLHPCDDPHTTEVVI